MFFLSRRFALFFCLVAVTFLIFSSVARAHVGSGGNCSACHGSDTPDQAKILASKLFKNDANRKDTGQPDLTALPVFDVLAGAAVDLQLLVNPTTDPFGVNLSGRITDPANRYGTISLVSGNVAGSLLDANNKLIFSLDSAWTTKPSSGTNPKWYTEGPFNSGTATAQTFTYHMLVDASTPSDYYQLTFTAAGGAEDWADTGAFYIHVLPTVPEPSTFVLLAGAIIGLMVWRKKKG
jgi:hypothetical protein